MYKADQKGPSVNRNLNKVSGRTIQTGEKIQNSHRAGEHMSAKQGWAAGKVVRGLSVPYTDWQLSLKVKGTARRAACVHPLATEEWKQPKRQMKCEVTRTKVAGVMPQLSA